MALKAGMLVPLLGEGSMQKLFWWLIFLTCELRGKVKKYCKFEERRLYEVVLYTKWNWKILYKDHEY